MVLSLDKCKNINKKKAVEKKRILAATKVRVCIYEILNWPNCSYEIKQCPGWTQNCIW